MRKLLAFATICATALVVAVSPANTAKVDDTHGGPVCSDITNDSGITNVSNGMLTFGIATVAPSCRGLTYTVWAYDETTGELLGTGSALGNKTAQQNGSGVLFVTFPVSKTLDNYCIVATSGDDRVFDRAPDTGCEGFSFSNPGGQTGFN